MCLLLMILLPLFDDDLAGHLVPILEDIAHPVAAAHMAAIPLDGSHRGDMILHALSLSNAVEGLEDVVLKAFNLPLGAGGNNHIEAIACPYFQPNGPLLFMLHWWPQNITNKTGLLQNTEQAHADHSDC